MCRAALGPKWIRRIHRITGLPIAWASGNGSYVFQFTTADHRHGWFNLKAYRSGAAPIWQLYDGCPHFSSCRDILGVAPTGRPIEVEPIEVARPW